MTEATCISCGATLTGRQRKACSKRCANKAYQSSTAGRVIQTRNQRRWRERGNSSNVAKTKPCARCGSTGSVRFDGLYCSRSCSARRLWSTSTALVHVGPLIIPPRSPEPIPSSGRTFAAGSCRRCSKTFVIIDQTTNNYCSTRCARAHSKERRRARERDAWVADVNHVDVFERDHWTCQLCGKPVVRTATVPHPRAPVIDHILPLAAGGTHEPANAQCAHFLCNSIKSDRPANDQLRLIG